MPPQDAQPCRSSTARKSVAAPWWSTRLAPKVVGVEVEAGVGAAAAVVEAGAAVVAVAAAAAAVAGSHRAAQRSGNSRSGAGVLSLTTRVAVGGAKKLF